MKLILVWKFHFWHICIHLYLPYSSLFIIGIHSELVFFFHTHTMSHCTYLQWKSEGNWTIFYILFIYTYLIHHWYSLWVSIHSFYSYYVPLYLPMSNIWGKLNYFWLLFIFTHLIHHWYSFWVSIHSIYTHTMCHCTYLCWKSQEN